MGKRRETGWRSEREEGIHGRRLRNRNTDYVPALLQDFQACLDRSADLNTSITILATCLGRIETAMPV